MNTATIKLVPTALQEQLMSSENRKYAFMALLILDTGIRISECVEIQLKDLHFAKRYIRIESKKKRKGAKDTIRIIPMSDRLIAGFSDYLKIHKDSRNPDAWIFPSPINPEKHLTRVAAWKWFKKHSDGVVNPHMFRHTFATRVVKEKGVRIAKELLGHKSTATTEIYSHVTMVEAREAIASIENPKSIFRRIYEKFFPPKPIHVLPTLYGQTKYHIGRKDEQIKIADSLEKKYNLLILGSQGTGKSHLLDNVKGEKILRIDDIKGIKKLFAELALFLLDGDKEAIAEQILMQDKEVDLGRIISRFSIKRISQLLCSITKPKEYTILVDDFTGITPTGIKHFEYINHHFHVIGAAREVKINKASFLTNFQILKLKNLSRPESTELILRASNTMLQDNRIENLEAYKNHIFDSTQGNPKYILEMVEQYEVQGFVSNEVTRSIRHTTALPEIDMSIPVIVLIGCVAVLRYLFRETGEDRDAGMFIGYAAMVFLLFARYFQRGTKRTTI